MKFRYSLENLRGLAILFVMFSHFSSFDDLGVPGHYAHFFVADATSWFVFLSGYLFHLVEGRRFRYDDYLLKKLKYVVLPYLVLSIPALAIGYYFGRPQLIGLSNAAYFGWSLLVGGSVVWPLWFIPMIVIFFVLSPVFNWAAKSNLIYLLALLGVIVSLFTSRSIDNFNPLLSFFHFLGFYLLGLACAAGNVYTDRLKESGWTPWLVCLGIAGFVLASWLYVEPNGVSSGFFDNLGSLNVSQLGKLSLLIALFFGFDKYFNQKNRALGYLADVSFGLFFIHGFYWLVFSRKSRVVQITDPIANFLIEFFLIVVCSIITVYFVKMLLQKRSRYVIGC